MQIAATPRIPSSVAKVRLVISLGLRQGGRFARMSMSYELGQSGAKAPAAVGLPPAGTWTWRAPLEVGPGIPGPVDRASLLAGPGPGSLGAYEWRDVPV